MPKDAAIEIWQADRCMGVASDRESLWHISLRLRGCDFGHQDGEFVAAEGIEAVFLARADLKAGGKDLRQFVTDRVAMGVVDGLEPVEIWADHGGLTAPHHLMELFLKQRAIGKAGQME